MDQFAQTVIATVQASRATWQEHHIRAEAEGVCRCPAAVPEFLVDQVTERALSPACSVLLIVPPSIDEPTDLRRRDGSSVYEVLVRALHLPRRPERRARGGGVGGVLELLHDRPWNGRCGAAGGRRQRRPALFGALAESAKALANGRRAELIDVLAQGERSVDDLALEIDQTVANTSQHLQRLLHAGLVRTRRDGTRIFYDLSGPLVATLWRTMRRVAEEHVEGLEQLATTSSATGRDSTR
ncbi:MAG: ArsR/SmtB family transcription factor [Nocardioidaceae bacterium]